MAVLSTNAPTSSIRASVAAFFTSFGRAIESQRAHAALNALSDRELADIGMTRGDIPARVAEVLNRN